jgi:hypothetical protein
MVSVLMISSYCLIWISTLVICSVTVVVVVVVVLVVFYLIKSFFWLSRVVMVEVATWIFLLISLRIPLILILSLS